MTTAFKMGNYLRSVVPRGGNAGTPHAVRRGGAANVAATLASSCEAVTPFPIGSHVKLLRSCGEYYTGKVLNQQSNNYRNECRILWSDDGTVSWVPTYKLEPHGVETELGWEEK